MDYMDFSRLTLTRQDCRTLEISEKEPVSKEQCERLLRCGLVEEERRYIPGSLGEPLGVCRATTLGRDYLVWLDGQGKTRRRETRRYWITTTIAILALVLALVSLMWQISDKSMHPKPEETGMQAPTAATRVVDYRPSMSRFA